MIRLSRTVIIGAAIAVAAGVAAREARADAKNEIRSVTFDEDAAGATTRIHIKGAQTPTFTVYKLERPSRVVVDVPQSKLADALRGHESSVVLTASTWAVSTISAQQLDDGGQVVRVMVTLARPGRYDVKTDGNEVVVMVSARDPAPKVASPEALAKMQAENEQARRAADVKIAAVQADATKARDAAAAAQAEAERLRKAAAEQASRAEAAQRAADDAKRHGQQANAADLARAKAVADAAKADAARARDEAARATAAATTAQGDAERAKQAAVADAQRARLEAEQAKLTAAKSLAEAQAAKASAQRETEAARDSASKAVEQTKQAEAARDQATREANAAKLAADQARAAATREADAVKKAAARDADAAKQDADRMRAEAEAARRDAARVKAEAAVAQAATAKQIDAAARAKTEAETARREADAARAEAAKIRDAVAKTKAEAETARREADAARGDAARTKAEADAAQHAAEAAKRDAAAKVKGAAEAAQREIAIAKADAAKAHADADAARTTAAEVKRQAEADKKSAEAARADADRILGEAKTKLATLDGKAAAAQALEDKARATHAAAQAREDAARDAEQKAMRDREQAQLAAKAAADRAADAAKKSSSNTATIAAEAKAAEASLAAAKRATDDAETRRRAAETAATNAKKELDSTKATLASVQQQRSAAESAAGDAARKRSEAEAAANDAARRRGEAETAANEAAKRRHDAELAAASATDKKTEAERERLAADQQRRAAEDAAKAARSAADAAEQQRKVAEAAAKAATETKRDAEVSLADLNAKRGAAERAAAELEARSKAEAKAQAELASAQAHKAGEAELAKVRTEVARLETERKKAETDLADRRKAVAAQQAESSRLETQAAQARDSAARAEARRAQLADQAKKPATPVKAAPAAPVAPAPAVASAPKPAGKPGVVRDIAFSGGSDGSARIDIALAGDANVTLGEVTATHVELLVDHADLAAAKLERKLDVSKFGSPVRAVSSFRDRRTPNRVRLVAELAQPATPTIDRDASGVHWRFIARDAVAFGVAGTHVAKATAIPTPVVGGFGAASTPVAQQSVAQLPPQGSRRRIYRGATVDFDFVNANLHDLLRAISDIGRVNIVVPDTIDAKVTVRLKRVPWDQALEVILASKGLWYRREGNLIRVGDRKDLDKEDEQEAARRAALVAAEVPRPELVPLNYASASELALKLKPMLSPHGAIEVDERTNQLIVTDVAGNREQIAKLAQALDLQTPQISIEARVVEARSTFLRQFGVQWGGSAKAGVNGGNATGLLFPSNFNLAGGAEDSATIRSGVAAPSDFAINLPASVGSGEGGGLGLALGSIGGNVAINLRLTALEDAGTVRIISAPKVTVLNAKKASIKQGVSIPISVISAAGTQTQFVQADLSLEVTPTVSTRDCTITMALRVEKNEPDFVNTGARGDPTILRKEAVTSMLVNDGETSVLGGIYTRNSGLAYKKFPFLADIPVFGWLFKNRRENDDRTEILVFITPKITNKQLLRCQ